jgi:ubiquinone biosynthesis protein
MSTKEIHRTLAATYGSGPDALFRYEQLELVASGSIASVFRAPWRNGDVAVKLQRPGIAQRMVVDLALMETLVRLAERLPKCRGMPLGNLMVYVSKVILGQLDFAREAASLSRIRSSLSVIPNVRVPAVVAEACRPGCLVMEFISGLGTGNVQAHTREARQRMAVTALMAVRQMIFVDGFVHCDLHPGNLYVTLEGEVVIIDAGFSVQLPDRVRRNSSFRCPRGTGGAALRSSSRVPLQSSRESISAVSSTPWPNSSIPKPALRLGASP